MLTFDPHPLLETVAFTTTFPRPLGELSSPPALAAGLALDAPAPVRRTEELRKAVRDLLRHGGYKPTGRGKPSAEYLVRAAGEGALGTINLAVDACNVASLASGLPISVVDLARTEGDLRVGLAGDESYVFNRSGQTIGLKGLLCLFDAQGPCANGVKDAQRTKTDESTTRTLSILWAPAAFADHARETLAYYRRLLEEGGAETQALDCAG